MQAALPLLNEGASVILCGSSGDVKASPGTSVYAASKTAIRSLARSWAAELVDRKIRVNVVAPGLTETPGLAGLFAGSGDALADVTSTVPMKRRAQPEEIGNVVAFLASDGSTFMTGLGGLRRRWRQPILIPGNTTTERTIQCCQGFSRVAGQKRSRFSTHTHRPHGPRLDLHDGGLCFRHSGRAIVIRPGTVPLSTDRLGGLREFRQHLDRERRLCPDADHGVRTTGSAAGLPGPRRQDSTTRRRPGARPRRGHRLVGDEPGGPGGSGLFAAAATALSLPDDRLTERFDLVGLDPRGVGKSEPAIDCYTDAAADRGDLLLSTQGTTVQWTEQDTKEILDQCAERSGGVDALTSVGTRDAARDIDVAAGRARR